MNSYYQSGKSFLFAINYSKTLGICVLTDSINHDQIKFSFPNHSSEIQFTGKINLSYNAIRFEDYKQKFNQVLDHILLGNSYLCNLTQATSISINLNLEEIFKYSHAPYKLYLKDQFVVFSPETFVEIKSGTIFTYPMKGTISADQEQNKSILLNDPKEDAEHNTIVDLLRNDLSIVANTVRVDRLKMIQKIDTNKGSIWQMSSQISGKLKPHYLEHPGDLFDKLLPAGSVTGAPKEKTLRILKDVENYDRGFYTGVFGYFDGVSIQSSVMIRFIENTDTGLMYKSGGGITSQSSSELEYQELIQKIYVPVF